MIESLLAGSSLIAIAKMTLAFAPFMFGAGSPGQAQYRISRCLRLRGGANPVLARTPSIAGNQKVYTLSFWMKRGSMGVAQVIWNVGPISTDYAILRINANDTMEWSRVVGSVVVGNKITSGVWRDPLAHVHVVLSVNASLGTAKIYKNGVEEAYSTNTNPSNTNGAENATVIHEFGRYAGSAGTQQFDGLLSEIYYVDGQALTPSDFAQIDVNTGAWTPKAYTGTYGTNGFHLDFADNSAATATALGKDSSGNGNNWTPTNISVTAGPTNDSFVDTPTNYGTDTGLGGEVRGNYCTLNPLNNNAVNVISQGNLHYIGHASTHGLTRATFEMADNTGTWTWEYIANANSLTGVAKSTATLANYLGADANGWGVFSGDGNMFTNGAVNGSVLAAHTTTDVMRFEMNTNTGVLTLFKGASSVGSRTIGSGPWYPATGRATGVVDFNFGQRPFSFTPTAGAKTLCTQNLPDPVIKKPSQYFDINLRAGTGSAFNVTGKEFQPDGIWIKGRSGSTDHALYDSTRGVQKDKNIVGVSVETTEAQGVTSFNSDGFSGGTLAKLNTNAATYVDWLFKAGVLPGIEFRSNTKGAGTENFSHSLGVSPSCVIHFGRTANPGFYVFHKGLTNMTTYYLGMHASSAASTATAVNAPTSTTFSVNTDYISNGTVFASWLFAEVPSFSKLDKYTGNGSADGTFVYCGFRPRWILLKRTDSTGDWVIIDAARSPFNIAGAGLFPNLTDAEFSASPFVDIVSSGFKLRSSGSSLNISGASYIFMAFAEVPFKYARAR